MAPESDGGSIRETVERRAHIEAVHTGSMVLPLASLPRSSLPRRGCLYTSTGESAAETSRMSPSDQPLHETHLGAILEEDVDTKTIHDAEKGIAIGAPIGAVAGMTALALMVPGAAPEGVGGILTAGEQPDT